MVEQLEASARASQIGKSIIQVSGELLIIESRLLYRHKR
jgi:hypothetical protein